MNSDTKYRIEGLLEDTVDWLARTKRSNANSSLPSMRANIMQSEASAFFSRKTNVLTLKEYAFDVRMEGDPMAWDAF